MPQLKEFQDGMIKLIENVKFKKSNAPASTFQRKLSEDIKKFKENQKVLVKGDKSTNFYEIQAPQYKEIMRNTISSEYKKATPQQELNVIKSDKKLATTLGISDRVEVMSKAESYVTVKDTKPDFENNPNYRIINPNKGNHG